MTSCSYKQCSCELLHLDPAHPVAARTSCHICVLCARLPYWPLQVRSAATAALQSAVVSAEVLGILPGSIERGLKERLLPPLQALSKKVNTKAGKDVPQVMAYEVCWLVCATGHLVVWVPIAWKP
eukprot:GHRR01018736.1.p1 GENE.GHRR01018736.1~~GHRR01018736.1.p1  ORF type:complete len:125 (+),score=32.60 GHRR01018736.1:709-1083(+)